ncbi:MAG: hypothetical protein ACHQX3_00730, partial [Nitrospirales bacterium]
MASAIEARAFALLKDHISAEQLQSLEERGYYDVKGQYNTWRLVSTTRYPTLGGSSSVGIWALDRHEK